MVGLQLFCATAPILSRRNWRSKLPIFSFLPKTELVCRPEKLHRCSGQPREFAEPLYLRAGGHGPVLLHHRAHLQVLLEDGVDVLHGRAAAFGDALAAFAVDDVVIAALLI